MRTVMSRAHAGPEPGNALQRSGPSGRQRGDCPAGLLPASAHRAVRAPGEPLPAPLRRGLESRFGADLGGVRVHSDAAATHDLSAGAFTVGEDVVFAPGRYAPFLPGGVRLLAHELTHVLQQRAAGGRVLRSGFGEPEDADEREADAVAHRVAGGLSAGPVTAAPSRVQRQGPVTQGANPPLRGASPPWMNMSEDELAALEQCIRIGGRSAVSACYASVLGWNVPDVSVAGRPEAERRQLTVSEVNVPPTWSTHIEPLFGTPPAAAPAVPAGTRVVVGTSVEGPFMAGAERVGAFFLDQVAKVPQPSSVLPPNTTFAIAIRATGQVFRLTRLGSALLYVEQVGPIRAEPASVPGDPVVSDTTVKAGIRTFALGPGWTTSQLAGLRAALEAMPTSALSALTPTIFRREPAPVCTPAEIAATTCDPGWAGRHRFDHPNNRHDITIFDSAFVPSVRRAGTGNQLDETILHEVGHALDYQPLASAMRTFNRTKDQPLAARTARLTGARSASGRRFKPGATVGNRINFDVVPDAASRAGEFRTAAIADGLVVDPKTSALSGGVTTYSEKNWAEQYAEAFSVFATDPELMRTIRPHLYAYFRKAFPE